MKVRNGFVSNSSSSSFVILKDSLSKIQQDYIVDYDYWMDKFLELYKKNELDNSEYAGDLDLEKFDAASSYYDGRDWNIKVKEDYIFGETSMDNFSFSDYLSLIKANPKFVSWDEGYNSEPYERQLDFVKRMKKQLRKTKIDKIEDDDQ